MTDLALTSKTIDRCIDVDRESERRWRPWKTGTFTAVQIIVHNDSQESSNDG